MTTNSGLAPELSKAPGNRKAGQPPRCEEAGGALPSRLDPTSAAWPKSRVDAIDRRLKAKAAIYEVGTAKDSFPVKRPPLRAPSPAFRCWITGTGETRDGAGSRGLARAGGRDRGHARGPDHS
jgi:hypothetical protein